MRGGFACRCCLCLTVLKRRALATQGTRSPDGQLWVPPPSRQVVGGQRWRSNGRPDALHRYRRCWVAASLTVEGLISVRSLDRRLAGSVGLPHLIQEVDGDPLARLHTDGGACRKGGRVGVAAHTPRGSGRRRDWMVGGRRRHCTGHLWHVNVRQQSSGRAAEARSGEEDGGLHRGLRQGGAGA